eukprot:Sspe_Gene.26628::Locus_11160_Transcript_1_1_Confidence_1.000_Length_1793::g.26628::m.26628
MQGPCLWGAVLLAVLAGGSHARLLWSIDCQGNLNLFDASRDEVALTYTNGLELFNLASQSEKEGLRKCCPSASEEDLDARANPLAMVDALTRGKAPKYDLCLDAISDSYSRLHSLRRNAHTLCAGMTGNPRWCGMATATEQWSQNVAVVGCENGNRALAMYSDDDACSWRWSDGTCPEGFKLNRGPSNPLLWKALSRVLGQKVEGMCVADGGDTVAGGWKGADFKGLEAGINPLSPGKRGEEAKLGCNDVLQFNGGALRAKGLGRLVGAAAEIMAEDWTGSAPYMLANGFWQPGMWLNSMFTDPAGKKPQALGDTCGVAKQLFEGCQTGDVAPLHGVSIPGTSTLNYAKWAKEGYGAAAFRALSGFLNVKVGVKKCEETPMGLPAFHIKGTVWCSTDSQCEEGSKCLSVFDFAMSEKEKQPATPAPTPTPRCREGHLESNETKIAEAFLTRLPVKMCIPSSGKNATERLLAAVRMVLTGNNRVLSVPEDEFNFDTPLLYEEVTPDDGRRRFYMIVGGAAGAGILILVVVAVVVYKRKKQAPRTRLLYDQHM